jgi:tetratricopeptide (TPR) repeat protein
VYLAYLVDEALELNENKEYDSAIELLDKALLIYPNYLTALNNKGNVLYRMKDYNYSRECYLRVIDIDPDYRKAKSNLRLANKKLGIKEAI